MGHTGLITMQMAKRQQKSLFNTTELYSHTQSPLPSHQSSIKDQNHSYGSPMGWEKAASKSRPLKATLFWQ